MTVWTHDLLNELRQIGDPELDPSDGNGGWRDVRVAAIDPSIPGDGDARYLQTWRRRATGALPEDGAADDPFWTALREPLVTDRLEVAQSLFAVYGGEIGATLLLASLPNAYAAEAGAAVLTTTRELQSNVRRRIAETAQLVVEVLFPDSDQLYGVDGLVAEPRTQSLLPGGRGYIRVRTTRLTHAVIRELVTARGSWRPEDSASVPASPSTLRGVPINQEDLLGTLGTFTVTVFEVMEKLGIPWNDEAEAAYLAHWDRVGALLGIGTPEVTDLLAERGVRVPEAYEGSLRPKTPAEARQLQALIRERCWPVPLPGRVLSPFANANGKVLVRALLDELQSAMPRGMERLPLVVMRYLVHDSAHELLGLGGGGVPDSLMRYPSEQRFTQRPARRVGRRLVQHAMRLAANDVSRRSFVHFIRSRADDPSQADFRFDVAPIQLLSIPEGRAGYEPVTVPTASSSSPAASDQGGG